MLHCFTQNVLKSMIIITIIVVQIREEFGSKHSPEESQGAANGWRFLQAMNRSPQRSCIALPRLFLASVLVAGERAEDKASGNLPVTLLADDAAGVVIHI